MSTPVPPNRNTTASRHHAQPESRALTPASRDRHTGTLPQSRLASDVLSRTHTSTQPTHRWVTAAHAVDASTRQYKVRHCTCVLLYTALSARWTRPGRHTKNRECVGDGGNWKQNKQQQRCQYLRWSRRGCVVRGRHKRLETISHRNVVTHANVHHGARFDLHTPLRQHGLPLGSGKHPCARACDRNDVDTVVIFVDSEYMYKMTLPAMTPTAALRTRPLDDIRKAPPQFADSQW